jgi:phage FluMu protein Com
MKGYCSRCKVLVEIKDRKEATLKNGTKAYTGKCPECDTEIIKRRD